MRSRSGIVCASVGAHPPLLRGAIQESLAGGARVRAAARALDRERSALPCRRSSLPISSVALTRRNRSPVGVLPGAELWKEERATTTSRSAGARQRQLIIQNVWNIKHWQPTPHDACTRGEKEGEKKGTQDDR